jgi:hypothetical protein
MQQSHCCYYSKYLSNLAIDVFLKLMMLFKHLGCGVNLDTAVLLQLSPDPLLHLPPRAATLLHDRNGLLPLGAVLPLCSSEMGMSSMSSGVVKM